MPLLYKFDLEHALLEQLHGMDWSSTSCATTAIRRIRRTPLEQAEQLSAEWMDTSFSNSTITR